MAQEDTFRCLFNYFFVGDNDNRIMKSSSYDGFVGININRNIPKRDIQETARRARQVLDIDAPECDAKK